MHIGVDFDNTIADYTGVFYRVAVNLGWVPVNIGTSKSAVKKYFFDQNQEPRWTELQGLVYGKEIMQAKPYSNCLSVLQQLQQSGHTISIISHKTVFPIIYTNPINKVNFHKAATHWLMDHGFIYSPSTELNSSPILASSVFFNETQEDKLRCIEKSQCDIFIDDLPKIFEHELFPAQVKPILFSPDTHNTIEHEFQVIHNWNNFAEVIND